MTLYNFYINLQVLEIARSASISVLEAFPAIILFKMTIFLHYPRSQVIASASSSSAESRRQPSNAQSKRISPGKSPLVHVHSGHNASSTPSTGLICSSTAVADASVRIHERNEFRRGVGLCVVNREGLVFAAK
jgi:hypothetical protein